jgi:rare lipoprotein A
LTDVSTSKLLAGIVAFFAMVQMASAQIKPLPSVKLDTILMAPPGIDSMSVYADYKGKLLKKNAHASFYADKFNGRRTASGKKFNNNKYTAAHRKLPFGTKLRVTNEKNGKWVVVEVTDRGPFAKGRELDLTRRAFMDIAHNKNAGAVHVTIEILQEK